MLGTAFFAYRLDREYPAEPGLSTLVRARPHGGPWGAPSEVPGLGDARVTADPEGGAVLAGTRAARRGDVGLFGEPVATRVEVDGVVGELRGPALANPGRAFTPSAVALAGGRRLLVHSLKSGPAAFSNVAPVAAVTLGPGEQRKPLSPLTARLASEPVAVPLAGSRAFVVWAGERGWGATLVSAAGAAGPTAVPPGPAPARFHSNATNRDVRTAGAYVALTSERAGRVRVTLRRP